MAVTLLVLGFGGFAAGQGLRALSASEAEPHAAILTIDGTIDPISSNFLARGLDVATDGNAQFLIVALDTPGGLLSSTRKMVETILAADIPVVVYVSPSGAQAASAGTFIVAAAHVAVMAPTTNIGAASPVGGGGEDLPETLKSKATEDAAAFLRSIAETRGRNSEALEETVLSATSYAASEALDDNIIDLIATDIEDLLGKLDGRLIELPDGEVVLKTEGLSVRGIERNLLERFLGFVANPDIAFLLLSIGGIGILVEFLNPGLIVPGVGGAIALALALVAVGNLPVNWAGVGLIGIAMVLFFAELQAPGIGVFGIGGAVCFILGAFLLFGGFSPPAISTPSFRVSLWTIGVTSAVVVGSMLLMYRTVMQSREARYPSASEALIGRTGVTATPLDPRGTIQVASERWSAVSDSGEPIPEGEEVIVLDVEGLTLKVFRAPKTGE